MRKKEYERYIHSSYLRPVVDYKRLAITIRRMTAALRPYRDKIDALAFTGCSGMLIGPTLCLRLKKPMLMVRKSVTDCHSTYEVEGGVQAKNYVIVDDIISTGTTVENIRTAIAKVQNERRRQLTLSLDLRVAGLHAYTEAEKASMLDRTTPLGRCVGICVWSGSPQAWHRHYFKDGYSCPLIPFLGLEEDPAGMYPMTVRYHDVIYPRKDCRVTFVPMPPYPNLDQEPAL